MWKFVLGFFFALHGLIHLGYVSPAPTDPKYPFSLGKSWLITALGMDASAVRLVGIALAVVTVVGFVFSGLAALGFIIPQSWGPVLTIGSSIASLLLLVLFWNNWLVLGVAIDVLLLVGLLGLRWQPFLPVGA